MKQFKNPLFVLAVVLLIAASILIGLGGLLDITGSSGFILSKEHFWVDGLFLLGVSLFALLIFLR
jgi:hypothetical protein